MILSRSLFRASPTALLIAALALPPPAAAQTNGTQTSQEQSLRAALSLISGGAFDTLGQQMQITQDADTFHVRIQLPKLAPPPDAAANATAVQLPSGVWNVTNLTLPPRGTLFTRPAAAPDAPPTTFGFTIGQQSGQARIDPSLATPSSYRIALGDIVFQDSGARPGEHLTLGHMTLGSVISGDRNGRVTTKTRATGDNWAFTGLDKAGLPVMLSVCNFSAHSDVLGLDQAKATRLRAAMAAAAAANHAPAPKPVPGQPPSLSPLLRHQLRMMIDGSTDLMAGFDFDETFQGFHFAVPNGSGDIGQFRVAAAGETSHGRVNLHVEFGLDDLLLPNLPPQFHPVVPRHVAVRASVTGVSATAALREFLRAAIAPDANPPALRAQALAMLNEPGARAGIETMSATIGPMQVQGSARVWEAPDATAAVAVHLTAQGADPLLRLLEADPKTQRIVPMLLIAKGLGQPEGDRITWDIEFLNGEMTVNGIPFGRK